MQRLRGRHPMCRSQPRSQSVSHHSCTSLPAQHQRKHGPAQSVSHVFFDLQGVTNNLRGFRGEMMALAEAPGVVAVCKKFRSAATTATLTTDEQLQAQLLLDNDSSSSDGSEAGSPRAASPWNSLPLANTTNSSSSSGSPASSLQQPGRSSSPRARCSSPRQVPVLQVEVDVVADEGLTWIEVKNQELFGVASGHYVGGSHGKGLAEQVSQLLAVAALPEHKRRGHCPQVVVYFPSGVDPEVAAALAQLGAKVADGPGSLAALCGVVGNSVTNLDVTTLCALVSEVSWRDPNCDALQVKRSAVNSSGTQGIEYASSAHPKICIGVGGHLLGLLKIAAVSRVWPAGQAV